MVSTLPIFSVHCNEHNQHKGKVRHELHSYMSCYHWISFNGKYCTKSTSLMSPDNQNIFFCLWIFSLMIQSFMHQYIPLPFSFVNDIFSTILLINSSTPFAFWWQFLNLNQGFVGHFSSTWSLHCKYTSKTYINLDLSSISHVISNI